MSLSDIRWSLPSQDENGNTSTNTEKTKAWHYGLEYTEMCINTCTKKERYFSFWIQTSSDFG